MNNSSTSDETFCVVITGASRGLGQAIAVQFAKHPNVRSLILIARTNLDQTKQQACKAHKTGGVMHVRTIQTDLGNLETLDETIAMITQEIEQQHHDQQKFDRLIFVNNAGSLGFIGKAVDTPSLQDIQNAMDLNVTSALWMAICLSKLTYVTNVSKSSTLLINISSLVAIQPFPTLALYSAAKAAREAYFQAMAAEGTTKTLNYAPGPLETEMTQEIRSSKDLDFSLKPHYDKQLVNPIDSARVLVDLVLQNEFESGQHIDYYDIQSAEEFNVSAPFHQR